MPVLTRREFLPALSAAAQGGKNEAIRYDLAIRGGRVIDPAQSLSARSDIGVAGGKVAAISPDIPASEAKLALDARGMIVTPGLVDVHAHVYDSVTPLGVPADPNCIAKGVTTVVDAGSAGANTFAGFRRFAIAAAQTRVYALLNISVAGLATLAPEVDLGELMDLRYANVKLAVQTVERNRDVILGVKVRLSRTVVGDHDLAALRLAREAAEAAHLPLMVHVGDTASTLPGILRELRPADVVTHVFHGWPQGILDERGRVLPEVRRAVASGVRLDVGHGRNSFSWRVAEAALAQGILPDTISSDLHQFNVAGPVFDLATTLSKFLHLGMTVEQVVERSTTNAARLFRFPHHPGTLRLGAAADIAIFRMIEGDFETADSPVDAAAPETRHLRRKLLPVATIKDGRLYGSPSIPGAP